ncbi:hypothetical protein [Actinomyces minihominis]|uniref:hypothetical protein n=1 Tax=Actinomyces minihominis TaxID=2002838 RepID=UPI000C07FC46|nr:hypothetical protein [Actinomyces minihominis]
MSAKLALYLAIGVLILLAVTVIAVAALVRRPRREWQVAVRGQAQDVRAVGISSWHGKPVKPRRVSLDEMWATTSVPQSAYVGAPKIPDRQAVLDALSPAPSHVIAQYTDSFARSSVLTPRPAPAPQPMVGEGDPFYEPAVITGEISLFNAALPQETYDDQGDWEARAEASRIPFKEVAQGWLANARTASAGAGAWLAAAAAQLREKFATTEDEASENQGEDVIVEVSEDEVLPEADVPVGDEAPLDDHPVPPPPPPSVDDLERWVNHLGESNETSEHEEGQPHWRSPSDPAETGL